MSLGTVERAIINQINSDAIPLWVNVFGTEPDSRAQLETGLTPVSDLKDILYSPGSTLDVTEPRKAALKILISHPEETKKLNEYLKTHPALKQQLADKFSNGTVEELTTIATAAVAGPDKLDAYFNKTQQPAPLEQAQTKPVTPPANGNVNTRSREALVTEAVLTELTTNKHTAEVANIKGVSILEKDGEYATKVSITVDGKTRYYSQISRVETDKSPTGFQASAWKEVDAKGNDLVADSKKQLWLCYPGYTGTAGDKSAQTASMNAVADKKLNPQTAEAIDFANSTLNKTGSNVAVNVAGHSLGASNAKASELALSARGVAAKSVYLAETTYAPLEVEQLKANLQDPNSELTKKLNISSADAIARLNNNSSDVTLRSATIDANGEAHLTRTAMLDPNATRADNALSLLPGHERNGQAAAGNGTIGDKPLYVNMTGAQNITNGDTAQNDPNHSLVNIANALQNNAEIGEIDSLKFPSPQQASAPVSQTPAPKPDPLANYPKFAEFIAQSAKKAKDAAGTDAKKDNPAVTSLLTDLDKNPEKFKKIAELIQKDDDFTTALTHQIDKAIKPQDGKPVDTDAVVKQLNDLVDLSNKPGDMLKRAVMLKDNVDTFLEAHPELKQFVKADQTDISKLTEEELKKKEEQFKAVSTLFDDDHKKVGQYLIDSINDGQTVDPAVKDAMDKVMDSPEELNKLIAALTPEVQDLILSGNFTMDKLPEILRNSQPLREVIKDQTTRTLIAGSKAVQGDPVLKAAFDNHIIDRMLGIQKTAAEEEDDQKKKMGWFGQAMEALQHGDLKGAIIAICSIMFGADVNSLASMAPGLLQNMGVAGQQQQQTQRT